MASVCREFRLANCIGDNGECSVMLKDTNSAYSAHNGH